MAATSEQQLYNFEGNMEASFRAWLQAKALQTTISEATETADDNLIYAQFQVGTSTEHVGYKADGTTQEYDQYACTVSIVIRTRRHSEDESSTASINTLHQERVGLVRKWLSVSQARGGGNLEGFLTLYELQFLVPQAAEYDVEAPDTDITTLNFAGQFSILPNAWPVS